MVIEMSKTRTISMENRWRSNKRDEKRNNNFKQREIILQVQASYVHCKDWENSRKRFGDLG